MNNFNIRVKRLGAILKSEIFSFKDLFPKICYH